MFPNPNAVSNNLTSFEDHRSMILGYLLRDLECVFLLEILESDSMSKLMYFGFKVFNSLSPPQEGQDV